VPHPIWGRDEETLQGLARQIADTALQQLTAAPVAA
jgi:hypothetical protein